MNFVGMPHPTNYDCALSVENLIREQSSIPATIALIAGRIQIGLSHDQLAYLADPAVNLKSIKLSRRDLARGIFSKVDAGTTVAGTMMLASHCGIQTFVTGGIGGVHRGAERSMDISADLYELGRTPMGVVCAGAKSILDLGLTLEVLVSRGWDRIVRSELIFLIAGNPWRERYHHRRDQRLPGLL